MGAKRLGGETTSGGETTRGGGTTRGKRLGGETTRGRNGLGAKRPGFIIDLGDKNVNYGGTNWASQIKDILQSHGFSNLWLTQDVNGVPFSAVKQRIIDVFQQTWYTEINNSSRLSSYCRFKHAFILRLHLRKEIQNTPEGATEKE